jgi:hypothetical protein
MYKTRDLVEACTFVVLGYTCESQEVVIEEGKFRVYFEFSGVEPELPNEFLAGSLLVEPTAFAGQHSRFKQLIHKLYQNNQNRS